tara:strand:+ start:965 stop:1273 length:309 start_codon:yes stop_codon:yes gene_type:complete
VLEQQKCYNAIIKLTIEKKMKLEKTLEGWNIENPKSKTEKVLAHLYNHKSIDTWEAIQLYKSTRLSGIIFNLRVKFNIKSKEIRDKKDGRQNYVQYILEGRK